MAASDYVSAVPLSIGPWLPPEYVVLGTDGYGRSDGRVALRRHFEVDRYYVAVAALKALSDDGVIPASKVAAAIKKYGIDPEKTNPAVA